MPQGQYEKSASRPQVLEYRDWLLRRRFRAGYGGSGRPNLTGYAVKTTEDQSSLVMFSTISPKGRKRDRAPNG